MNGYTCPCCQQLIAIAKRGERRTCPTCHASVETQRTVREHRHD